MTSYVPVRKFIRPTLSIIQFKELKRAWNIDALKDKARGALAINR